MSIIKNILIILLTLNTLFAVYTVFKEKRDIAATWAWLLVLILLPGIGFIIYLFFGRKISKNQIFDLKTQYLQVFMQLVKKQKNQLKERELLIPGPLDIPETYQMIKLFLTKASAPLTTNNALDLFFDGKEKFDQLLEDIEKAEDHIHVMYYIFRDDKIGTRIIEALEKKAAEGVKVNLIFDSLGSRGVKNYAFKTLIENGGKVLRSFEDDFILLNTNINFRNHRKIVVIDGKLGYMGGFNVGDDYLGEYENRGYWRDSHIRLEGNAVHDLQARFIMDWNASTNNDDMKIHKRAEYFPRITPKGNTKMQVVSSGPDSEHQAIKKGFMKMISLATDYIYIQTPYFIPDEGLMETIKIAIYSGIKVKLMIPNKPDHPFVYSATLYYARELVDIGAEVYIYDNGFLHSKLIIVDGIVSSLGTANFDVRSFKLNFEINAFIYDEKITKKMEEQYAIDIDKSYLLTPEIIADFSKWFKFRQAFSRLLSPIL